MRSQILTVLAGAVGLAAIAAAAPALSSYNADVCEPISTVFVTIPQPVTVTVHDAPTNTAHLFSPSDALPTTTITRYSTVRSTTTVPHIDTIYLTRPESTDGVKAAVSTPISYDTTVYETVTVHQTSPATSSSSLLAFIVENGTTFWLGGNTPISTKSYVIATSVVTIEPINTVAGTTHLTTTLTLHSTRYTTRPSTVTRTLSAFNGTTIQTSGAHVASSFGTVPAPVRTSTSWAGWNATSTAGGAVFPGATDPAKTSKSEVSFVTKETVNIYKTTGFSFTVSTYTAKGGFNAFTTPSTLAADPSATSAAGGIWTSAVIDGQTVSWNAHGVTQTCTESPTRAPYTNTTSAIHSVTSADPSSTSSAQGVWTTAVIDGQTVSWNGNGVTRTCSESIHSPYANTASTTHPLASSMAAGVLTSSADPTLSSAVATSSSSSSNWYIYTPVTSAENSDTTTGSALGGATLVPSSSVFSSARPVSVSTATVIPIPASASRLSASQVADPSLTSSETTQLLSSSTSIVASSHMGTFSTTSSSSFLTLASSSVVDPSAALQTSSTVSNTVSITSSISSSASSIPSNCGEVGDFVLNFDDIPPLSISNDSTFSQPQPIFSPYHHFDFSGGFRVAPPPVEPYLPESKPLLVEFMPSTDAANNVKQARPNADSGTTGYMRNADHGLTSCFSFNLYGASFGCDSQGPDCDFTFTGYRYDAATQSTKSVANQQLAISACPTPKSLNCILTPMTLDSTFKNLDQITINATVQGVPKMWWMDDLRLGWFDNTCEKGMCRAKAPVRGFALPTKN
ncbi:hypothetical protein IFR05_002615 [Cadophora sp. M221]|nr:hypothetical protein IFR05_002615 [Cadophora sp. M221]